MGFICEMFVRMNRVPKLLGVFLFFCFFVFGWMGKPSKWPKIYKMTFLETEKRQPDLREIQYMSRMMFNGICHVTLLPDVQTVYVLYLPRYLQAKKTPKSSLTGKQK